LGLFGLAAYAAERRTKEIGIRKALGATAARIVGLLSKDFLLLVGLACAVAVPVAYVALQQWLGGFAYRIALSPWLFVAASVGAAAIAGATISYQALRAAYTDPATALRDE
jgi:putative ABC transport system permease protein